MEDINKFCTNCHWCLNTEELEEDSQEIFSEPVCARTPTIINRGNIFGCIYHITDEELFRGLAERATEQTEAAKNNKDIAEHRELYTDHIRAMADHMKAIERIGIELVRRLDGILHS